MIRLAPRGGCGRAHGDPVLDWYQYEFMRHALLAVALIAPMCGAMGVHVVNFRMVYFSDAVSHSAFTAVALAMMAGLDPTRLLPVVAVLIAWAVMFVRKRTRLSGDSVIGVVSASVIALGLALAPRGSVTRGFDRVVFGRDLLLVEPGELALLAALFAAVCVFQFAAFNRLIVIGVDRLVAHAQGIRAERLEWIFITLLALVVVTALQISGVLLVTALLVIPAATARNLARSAGGLLLWAVAVAEACGVGGVMLSWYADLRTGPAIVLLCSTAFIASLAFRKVAKG